MDEIIKIDPKTSNKLEFDVVLQNTDGFEVPRVRFITSGVTEDVETIHKCSRVHGEKDKWVTTLAPLAEASGQTLNYRIEVIVDGYYFEAANGSLELAPLVESAKPSVSVSFKPAPVLMEAGEIDTMHEVQPVVEPVKPVKTKKVAKQVTEAVAATEVISPEAAASRWKELRGKILKGNK